MTHHCIHEDEVVAAVLSHRWDAADEGLKRHAADCEICQDVVAVAGLLSADQERSRYEVRVPAAGQVWWRSAVRARLEAAQAATRPLTWVHGIAGACAVGLAWALVGMVWPSIRMIVGWLATQTLGVAEKPAARLRRRGVHRPGAGRAVLCPVRRQRPLTTSIAPCGPATVRRAP